VLLGTVPVAWVPHTRPGSAPVVFAAPCSAASACSYSYAASTQPPVNNTVLFCNRSLFLLLRSLNTASCEQHSIILQPQLVPTLTQPQHGLLWTTQYYSAASACSYSYAASTTQPPVNNTVLFWNLSLFQLLRSLKTAYCEQHSFILQPQLFLLLLSLNTASCEQTLLLCVTTHGSGTLIDYGWERINRVCEYPHTETTGTFPDEYQSTSYC
jgi:hypothetical protein